MRKACDYEYDYAGYADGSCNLDEANAFEFTDGSLTSDSYIGYAYVTTTEFSGVPIGFMGQSDWGEICGFTP